MAEYLCDYHLHSTYSDGMLTPKQIVNRAKKKGIKEIAIADHDTANGYLELCREYGCDPKLPYIEIDGVRVISATEVTCRVNSDTLKNEKGNTCKVHLLVYGADLSENSPLRTLLDIKLKNDYDYNFGKLVWLLDRANYDVSVDEIRSFMVENNFQHLTNDDIRYFLFCNGITIAPSEKRLHNLMQSAPIVKRKNIMHDDLCRFAHICGGKVIVAHPGCNIRRTAASQLLIDVLCRSVDGFEMVYNHCELPYNVEVGKRIKETFEIINSKPMISTAGTDCHFMPGEYIRIGSLGTIMLNEEVFPAPGSRESLMTYLNEEMERRTCRGYKSIGIKNLKDSKSRYVNTVLEGLGIDD